VGAGAAFGKLGRRFGFASRPVKAGAGGPVKTWRRRRESLALVPLSFQPHPLHPMLIIPLLVCRPFAVGFFRPLDSEDAS